MEAAFFQTNQGKVIGSSRTIVENGSENLVNFVVAFDGNQWGASTDFVESGTRLLPFGLHLLFQMQPGQRRSAADGAGDPRRGQL